LISSERAILFQLTLSDAFAKVPHKKNAYPAIYDNKRFSEILKTQTKLKLPKGNNFAESVLQLTNHPSETVTIDSETGFLVNEKREIPPFIYIVVTARDVKTDAEWKQKAEEFPWIRVIHKSFFASITDTQCLLG